MAAANVDPSEFSVGEMRAGKLFWMPPGATWLNRDKARPFALANGCRPHDVGTLVYGSSQRTEQHSGAAFIEVSPIGSGLHRNGLRVKTFFYPGILMPLEHGDLPRPAGFLGKSLGDLRTALRRALGIGQGSCRSPGAPRGSRRGRIVVLNGVLARTTRTRFAVILTEAVYSREANYQVILPIYSASAREAGADDLILSTTLWSNGFPGPVQEAVLLIPTIHSVWHAHAVSSETEHVMDDQALAKIDRGLCDYFSLPPSEEEG